MKKIQKIVFLATVFLMASVATVFAQARQGRNANPEERAQRQAQKWKTELGLTDSQTESMETAIKNRMTKMQALREQNKDDKEERGQEGKQITEEFEAQVKIILTPTQYTEYEKRRDEKKAKMKDRKGKGRGKHKGQNDDDDDDDM